MHLIEFLLASCITVKVILLEGEISIAEPFLYFHQTHVDQTYLPHALNVEQI